MRRYFIIESLPDGGDGETLGNQKGYKTSDEACKRAQAIVNRLNVTASVDLYEVAGENKDHIDTVEYFSKE